MFVIPDGSFGVDPNGNTISGQTTTKGELVSKSAVFMAESGMNGDDATNPMTFGHELGHALGVTHYKYGFRPPVPVSYKRNLMYEFAPSGGDDEVLTARKRLVQEQIDTARSSVFLQP